jgi:hypothetical protein
LKGSKRNRWLKDGMKVSKKYMKSVWNRQTRRKSMILPNDNMYKKLKAESAYISVL